MLEIPAVEAVAGSQCEINRMNVFSSGWREQDTYPHVVTIDGCTVDESHGWPRDSFYERHELP